MPLKTAASLDNRAVVKTEIGIPRDSVVVNNSEMLRNKARIGAINDYKKKKNKCFDLCRRENDFQERNYFVRQFQNQIFLQK